MRRCPDEVNKYLNTENIIKNIEQSDQIFESKNDKQKTLSRVCYGDLYIIGSIWIQALKCALVGAKTDWFPVVEAAAKKEEPPKRPPPMKYTDLPLYECPHHEYKAHKADKYKCPDANVKLLHKLLLPHVKNYRKQFQQNLKKAKHTVTRNWINLKDSVNKSKENLMNTMRDPQKLEVRKAVVVAGGVAGFFMGSGGGVPRRLIFTGAGLLSAGALCFPEETDESFRTFLYYSGKFGLALYNKWCGTDISLRERLPCKDDLPPDPPNRPPFPDPKSHPCFSKPTK